MKMRLLLLGVALFFWLSCDGGLAPPQKAKPRINGTIRFVSTWPPQDSVQSLKLFASKLDSLDSAKVFAGIFNGTILLRPSLEGTLPYRPPGDTLVYSYELSPGTYYYIGVLQQVGVNTFDVRSFRVVGMLMDSLGTSLKRITLREEEVATGLNINVDFYNLPPQPF